MKHFITTLLLLLSIASFAEKQDTTIVPLEHKIAFNKVFESEKRYHQMYFIKQEMIDSLTKAVNLLLGVKGLVVDNEFKVGEMVKNYQALDEADKIKVAALEKEIRKLKREIVFTKVVLIAVIAGEAVVIGYLILKG